MTIGATMTKEQITARLNALFDYEMSLYHNTWDDNDRITNELLKVQKAQAKLQEMLKGAIP
jgi:hypothetical protein